MRRVIGALLAAVLAACGASTNYTQQELVIFHAGSLAVPLKEAAAEFETLHPGVAVELESGGSLDSARKISDLGRACHIFASADFDAITKLLIPEHASWYLVFASNRVVLAYRPNIDDAQVPTNDNWPDLLLNPESKFGRSDPDGDPAGYRAVLTMKLAESFLSRPGIPERLLAKDTRFIRPKSGDLIAMLETGALDYAFVYKSVAIQHKMPYLEFPPELNLGDPAQAARYASVSVDIAGETPGETMTIGGLPILYALTIPHHSPDPALSEAFVRYFLSNDGGLAVLERNHQQPLVPAATPFYDDLPESLKPFARPTSP